MGPELTGLGADLGRFGSVADQPDLAARHIASIRQRISTMLALDGPASVSEIDRLVRQMTAFVLTATERYEDAIRALRRGDTEFFNLHIDEAAYIMEAIPAQMARALDLATTFCD